MKKNYFLGMSPEGFHKIAYTEWGNWSNQFPAIICVHGLTRNSHDFDELSTYFSNQGRYLLCPDIVGRGDSDRLSNPAHYTYPQYLADMNVLIARINMQHIDWIGTSMGGIIGMILASLPNSPIRKLVLNDIGPQISLIGLRRLAKYAGKNSVFQSFEEAKQYCKINYAEFGALSDEQWEQFTRNSIKQTPNGYVFNIDPGIKIQKSLGTWLNELIHNPRKALEGIVYDIDLWDIWKKIRCPVLVIRGKHSDLLTPETIIKMQETHADTESYEIEDAGHAPALLELKHHETIYNWLKK